MKLKLVNGEIVELADSFTVGQIKKLKRMGLIPQKHIKMILNGVNDLSNLDLDEFENIAYAAYFIKNENNAMDQETFEDLLEPDIYRDFEIIEKLISKKEERTEVFQDNFKKVTNFKKKNRQRNIQK